MIRYELRSLDFGRFLVEHGVAYGSFVVEELITFAGFNKSKRLWCSNKPW
jgi:hypothetical protein